MTSPEPLATLLRRVTTQVRLRRAEHFALRGAFWGSVVAVVVLALRSVLDPFAIPAALGLVAAGLVGGFLYGVFKRTPVAEVARLADRAFGLDDRVATAVEWAARPDRTPLVDALVADATGRVERLEARQIARRVVPREAPLLPVALVVGLALVLAPPLPLPVPSLPDFSMRADDDDPERRTEAGLVEEQSRQLAREPLRRPGVEERDFLPRTAAGGGATAGDATAVFKDTSLATQRPDFNSFLKKGDERLRLLEQVDRLPDLQSDFTTSQYKMMFRKSKALSGGLRPDQISPEKLRELLQEMERLGRRGGNWSGDAAEGMDALEYGDHDRALEAMEKALNKMRAMEDRQRAGKNLRGGRQGDGTGRDGSRGGEGMGPEDMDFGEGEGSLPGRGKSPSPKGEASHRLQATPYDVGVEGEARAGRREAYDTNLTGRGGPMASRLQYLGVIGQYRKMMEDAITREAVPRDYHDQIKDYFQALDER